MIHEVDEGIRRMLAGAGVPGGRGELAFDAPTSEWTAKRNAPTINVFLYDIREDLTRRHTGSTEEHDGEGMIVGWRSPPRWFHLSYLVTAWTNRPTDEHRLLSDVLACLVSADALAPQWLTGTLAELGLAVTLQAAGPVSEGRAATDVWTALGGELKPAIDLRVTAPLAGPRTPAGPPVTEGVVVLAGSLASAVSSTAASPVDAAVARHLRYEGTTRAQGDGFAVSRPKPPAPARRRRGSGP